MEFGYSARTRELQEAVGRFMDQHIYPNEARYWTEIEDNTQAGRRWTPLALIEDLKPKARAAGLWNLFLPDSEHGAGLTNLEYAPLCEMMGRVDLGAEVFNCSAPDTGNMEVLVRYGTAEQKKRWLEPLLAGEIRSAFRHDRAGRRLLGCHQHRAPHRAARATTTSSTARKWWTSGAGDPRCKIADLHGQDRSVRAAAQRSSP